MHIKDSFNAKFEFNMAKILLDESNNAKLSTYYLKK